MNAETVLITGASRGIGRACAEGFAAAGATVIGTATTQAGADKLAADIDGASGEVLDLLDADSAEGLLARLTEQDQMPSVLVNNAGINRDNLLMRMKDDEWNDVFTANVTGMFQLTRGCLRPMLKARHGRIINLSSIVAHTGNAGQANYTASKAAIIGFTRSLAREVGSRGITANCVAPGFIETDMTAGFTEEQRAEWLTRIPLGRLGTPADIAAAVLFLAGPGGAYITGETLHVNGGMHFG